MSQEACPFCGARATTMYEDWSHMDYPLEFDFECLSCGEEFKVEVEAVPNFICFKPGEEPII